MGHPGRVRAGIVGLLATAASVVTGLPGVVPAAHAADGACDADRDVRLVVEFHQLAHDDLRACLPTEESGEDAAALLEDAGLELTDVQRQPGFVCRVDGLPADDPCVNTPPAEAYWALWWSDGSSPDWVYSTVMASSLEVPAGGAVALVWNQGSTDVRPSGPAGADPSRTATRGATKTAGTSQETTATPDGAESGDSGGLPGWVAPVGIAVLLAAAGAVAVIRRRSGAPPA